MKIPGELMPQEVEDILQQCAFEGALLGHSLEDIAARSQRGLFWAKQLASMEVPF